MWAGAIANAVVCIRLEQLLGSLDTAVQLTECRPTEFETYTVRLGHAGEQGRELAVPARLMEGLVRGDPVASRVLSGVLALNVQALRAASEHPRQTA